MATTLGKKFEDRFKKDYKATFPQSTIIRLPDQQSKYYGTSSNICDFICFNSPRLYLVECKSKRGNTFPWSDLRQYDEMIKYKDNYMVVPVVIIWYIEHDTVIAVRIDEIEKMKNDGLKSINIKNIHDEVYNIVEIPSKKLRTFMESDYTKLEEIK